MKEIQMTEASTIFTPLEEVKGTGKVHSENNLDAEVDFHLQILKNGKGIGTVFFKTVHPNINHFSIFGSVANYCTKGGKILRRIHMDYVHRLHF